MKLRLLLPSSLLFVLPLSLSVSLALLCALTGPVCAAPPPSPFPAINPFPPTPTAKAAINAGEQTFLQAVLNADVPALDALLAADFVYVHENGLISTKAQWMKDFLPTGYTAAVSVPNEPMRQYGSTVFTISTGHLQLKTETPYPTQTVTHIWAEEAGTWRLAHRHESHKGEPIGKQLSLRGGPNLTGDLGSKPSPALAKVINEREASWVYGMVTMDRARMDELVDDSIRYTHVTDHTSDKKNFMRELAGGYTETYFLDATMRQFGDTVLVLHRAQYRHTGLAEQSPSMAMHAWFKRGDRWVLVGRHSSRFESY